MKLALVLALLAAAAAAANAELPTTYNGYKVYNVTPRSSTQASVLKLFDHGKNFDFWSRPPMLGLPATIMVAPRSQKAFTNLLELTRIEHSVVIENVEAALLEESVRQVTAPRIEKGRISFTQYHRYDAIEDYLAQLAITYPDIVTLENVTESTQGRTITLIKIGTGGADKPAIFIESGIHAREWIAPATALYIVQQLVENTNNRQLIETVDWYIIPLLNPDGYEFSHGTILSRLWRKTRSPGTLLCVGVDGNRNFDYHWMEVGASSNQCAETFAGPQPFSEPECAGLRDVVLKYKDNVKLFLSVHSFGNYLLYPWGYTSALPDNHLELQALGEAARDAIQSVAGTTYTVGSSTNVLYAAAGISPDWATGVAGIALSYTIELPGGGIFGFDLPASRILPVGEETWQGIKAYHTYVENKFVRKI